MNRRRVIGLIGGSMLLVAAPLVHAADLEVHAEGTTPQVDTSNAILIPVAVTYRGQPVTEHVALHLETVGVPPGQCTVQVTGNYPANPGLFRVFVRPLGSALLGTSCTRLWKKGATLVRIQATYPRAGVLRQGETMIEIYVP